MIKVLKDNTKETYYTRCKNCNSELEYDYSDVTIIEVPISYHTDKRILCPVCGKDTLAELSIKDEYKDALFSLKQNNTIGDCCTPIWNSGATVAPEN
jgi:transcription elongation factor Elf1